MDAKLRLLLFAWTMLLPFLWFTVQARRTFLIPSNGGPGMMLGAVSIFSGIALALWEGQHAPYRPMLWAAGATLAVCSIALYESARRVVTGRGFCTLLSGVVPPAVCRDGPYRYMRHPVYTSYILAFLALVIAFPSPETAIVFALNLGFFVYAATDEERTIAHSAIAQAYAAYQKAAGMFLPRFGRASAP